MVNLKYECPIPGCPVTSFSHHLINHLLKHSSEDLIKSLGQFQFKMGANQGLLVNMKSKVNKIEHQNKVCFGCKKFFKRIPLITNHKRDCPCKEEHKAICKGILEPKKPEEPEEPEEIVEPQNERIVALKYLIDEFAECKTLLEINFPELYKKLTSK